MKILLVDDNQLTLSCLQELIRLQGHETVVALTGEEAVRRRQLWKPDLVILDLILPRMSGLDVLRQLRQFSDREGCTRAPVIVITAASDTEIGRFQLQASSLEPYCLLKKPFEFEHLMSTVEQLLEQSHE